MASGAVAGSHSRNGRMSGDVKIAGVGRETQPSSIAVVKYATEPTRFISYASPAVRIASLTAGPSSHGPNSSQPGLPAIVCCIAVTAWPAIVTCIRCSLGTVGIGAPVSCCTSAGACGPST